jgi:hypothetical protein
MHYQCLIISDSGAVEFSDKFLKSAKPGANALRRNAERNFQIDPPMLEFEMYDDPEFNRLSDMLHAPEQFIINDRVKNILKSFKLPEHKFGKAKVTRVDKNVLFWKFKRDYEYHWLYFNKASMNKLYEHIDFQKSDIEVYEGKNKLDIKIKNLDDVLKLRSSQRYYKLKSIKIVLRNFDSDIDMFTLPFFSWMTYVSDRLRNKLQEEGISDIKFVNTGVKSRPEAVQNPLLEII